MKASNSIVVVHLYGGVGNQLFQYTFGEYIRNKYALDIYYDVSSFGVLETFRDYQLDVITEDLPVYNTNKLFFSRYKGIKRYLLRAMYKCIPFVKYICDYEDSFTEDVLTQGHYKTLYLDGYWHDKKYALWMMENHPKAYSTIKGVPNEISEYIDYTENNETISLHIRRGDYLKPENSNLIGACSNGYYERAISILKEKHPKSKILVFSDDIDWVRENLKFDLPMSIVRNDDIKPFWYIFLMSRCNYHVISNSTFSWWGAFLNNKEGKDVVMPAKWYAREENPNIYFDSWIKIK